MISSGSCISDGPESKTETLMRLCRIDVSNFQSVRVTIISGAGSEPQGSEVCHTRTNNTVTLQKVLDNKSSQLTLHLWLCHRMIDGTLGQNQTPEPPQSCFRVVLSSYGLHRLIHTVYSLTIWCTYCTQNSAEITSWLALCC